MKKILLLIALLVLVGCSPTSVEEENTTSIPIKHALGETDVKENPEKVVIFDLGVLDIFDALDIEVAGVPKSNLSARLEKYNHDDYVSAGTLFEPDYEVLAEMAPDLIIISGRAAGEYDELSKIAPTIALTIDNSDFIGSLFNRLETVGSLYPAKVDLIETEISNISESVKDIKAEVEKHDEQTLFILTNGDSMSIYGPGSRFGIVYDDLGFKAIDGVTYDTSTHGQQISFEFIAQYNPDNIIVMDRVVITGDQAPPASDLLNNDLIKDVNAFKNNKVFYVDPHVWYVETGGLNSTKHMIEEMASIYK